MNDERGTLGRGGVRGSGGHQPGNCTSWHADGDARDGECSLVRCGATDREGAKNMAVLYTIDQILYVGHLFYIP